MLRLVICLVKEKKTFHYLVHNKTKKKHLGFHFLSLKQPKKTHKRIPISRTCKVKKMLLFKITLDNRRDILDVLFTYIKVMTQKIIVLYFFKKIIKY